MPERELTRLEYALRTAEYFTRTSLTGKGREVFVVRYLEPCKEGKERYGCTFGLPPTDPHVVLYKITVK